MAIAVLAALQAKATGKAGGQNIEVSMLDSALSFFWSDAMGNTGAAYVGDDKDGVLNDEVGKPRQGRRAGQRVLPTKDGFAAMMIWPFAPHWDKVITAFEITEPEFQDNKSEQGLATVIENYYRPIVTERSFFQVLEGKFAAMTNAEIDALAAEYELPLGVVIDIDDFQRHPQIQHMVPPHLHSLSASALRPLLGSHACPASAQSPCMLGLGRGLSLLCHRTARTAGFNRDA